MSESTKKEIVIMKFNVIYGVESAEKEANKIVSRGYELFSSTSLANNMGQELILIFKKKKE